MLGAGLQNNSYHIEYTNRFSYRAALAQLVRAAVIETGAPTADLAKLVGTG